MDRIKKTVLTLAAVCALLVTGCAKKGSSSSVSDSSSASEQSSAADSQSDSSQEQGDSSEPVKNELSDNIKKAAAFFDGENYEYVCKVTGDPHDAQITLIRDGNVCFQSTAYKGGEAFVYCDGKDTYRFDTFTMTYQKEKGKVTLSPSGNLITEAVKKELPATKTRISNFDTEKYKVEEYTYTAPAYITVLDFCFDKTTGELKNYTATYSVEGRDNEVQYREVLKMVSGGAKVKDISAETITRDYTELASLSEEKREELCRKLFIEYNIKNEDLYENGVTLYDLKTIKYTDLAGAVIANAADAQPLKKDKKDDSSEKDSSSDKDSSSVKDSSSDKDENSSKDESSKKD